VVVTRSEIADHIEGAFRGPARTKGELLASAEATDARPDVLATLQTLPERRYGALRDLWSHLPEVPVEL
jgi:hypothetical protein